MTLVERINLELKEAIRSRDQIRLNTLRMLKSKILAVDARGNLPDPEVLKLFKTYLGNLKEARELAVSRPEMVEQLDKEMTIVQEFLPKALSEEETKVLHFRVAEAIEQAYPYVARSTVQDHTPTLAYHWAMVGDVAKERYYTALAGLEALQHGAFREAVRYLEM